MRIDVHGCTTKEALRLVMQAIESALDYDEYEVQVVHGFNKGSAIQKALLHLSSSDHPDIVHVRSNITNPGVTIIQLRMQIH